MLYRRWREVGAYQDTRGMRVDSRRSTRLVAAVFAASLVVAGCGDDGDEPSIPQSGERETTTTESTTTTDAPTITGADGSTTTTAANSGSAATTSTSSTTEAPAG
jgi:hypothetical protein